jgi:hypothetical protein
MASSPPDWQVILGVCLMLAGAALVIVGEHERKPSAVIAIHHQSFDGNARPLAAEDLPPHLRKSEIIPLPITQSALFKDGILQNPKEALRLQSDFKAQLSTLRRSHPAAPVGYCGKAHIPLAFTVAHLALSEVPVLHFEFDRTNGGWRHLDDRSTTPLDLEVSITAPPQRSKGEAVLTVAISYPIDRIYVAQIVHNPVAHASIAIKSPRIDCITHASHIEEIAGAFRRCLDQLTPAARIHLFLAAPMSVVVALGRRLSPTLHSAVVVHNFTDKTNPKYAWGIHVNAKGGPTVVSNPRKKT